MSRTSTYYFYSAQHVSKVWEPVFPNSCNALPNREDQSSHSVTAFTYPINILGCMSLFIQVHPEGIIGQCITTCKDRKTAAPYHTQLISLVVKTGVAAIFKPMKYVIIVTIPPHMPQKTSQNDDATKADDLKRHAHDIACDSHGIEDKIRAMVSSYMARDDDEEWGVSIGQMVLTDD